MIAFPMIGDHRWSNDRMDPIWFSIFSLIGSCPRTRSCIAPVGAGQWAHTSGRTSHYIRVDEIRCTCWCGGTIHDNSSFCRHVPLAPVVVVVIKASTSSFIIILTCSLSDTSLIIIWSIIFWWAPLGRLLLAVSSRIGPEALKRSLIQLVLDVT